ncbi:hypothetical protein G2W53_026298 [Senna tora]|uniref:Uncharacterized protein n=1 Tax=Senna tora TaxID=362788 RepID=A0A834TES8_9FABA|nr:hypothetical protein G2W53_026298 [Senna tora]
MFDRRVSPATWSRSRFSVTPRLPLESSSLNAEKRFFAKSIQRALALHPMPEMLKLLMSLRREYLLTMMELREGMGQKALQFKMRMSISRGEILCKAGGRHVSSLCPEEVRILAMKFMLSLLKEPNMEAFSRNVEMGALQYLRRKQMRIIQSNGKWNMGFQLGWKRSKNASVNATRKRVETQRYSMEASLEVYARGKAINKAVNEESETFFIL